MARSHALLAAAAVATLTLSACGAANRAPENAATAAPTLATPRPERTAVPTAAPEGEAFTLDQAATYPDGLSIEIRTLKAEKAGDGIDGAEGTDGSIAVATVRIANATSQPFDPEPALVSAYYGPDRVPAVMVSDSSGRPEHLGDGFTGAIAPGESAIARIGWAVPADQLGQVTVAVDPRSADHPAALFTGPAAR